ncbi:Wall-associated protein precursor [Hyalangium gracile]|uniref:Wall-associated protein precursor n=1 Tax=Hyalangium gracile TaxID=394092 RepID=UPI001CC91FA3|nr:Wall-associated protein precursor [Hyalangium gracile]
MLPLLLLLVVGQAPALPGETTLVSFCKQRRMSACEALQQTDPKRAAEIEAEAAKNALRLEALKVAEESRDQEDSKADESSEAASGEPPDCKGQNHHVISRRIAEELERHETLAGLYKPRDERFKTRAKDEASHCGYQDWHRKVDAEVIKWLRDHVDATPEQFMKMLREIYKRPDLLDRFPHGF